MSWSSVFNILRVVGEVIGLASKAKQVVTPSTSTSTPDVEPVDAEKARAGTIAGGAQYVAGRKAGKHE